MKTVYLIRHGLPEFPGGKGMCLGTTDIPMAEAGLAQAERFENEREETAHRLFANLDSAEKEALLATLSTLLSDWESLCCCDKKNEKEDGSC